MAYDIFLVTLPISLHVDMWSAKVHITPTAQWRDCKSTQPTPNKRLRTARMVYMMITCSNFKLVSLNFRQLCVTSNAKHYRNRKNWIGLVRTRGGWNLCCVSCWSFLVRIVNRIIHKTFIQCCWCVILALFRDGIYVGSVHDAAGLLCFLSKKNCQVADFNFGQLPVHFIVIVQIYI